MDEEKKSRVEKKLAAYFVKKKFMRNMGYEVVLPTTKEAIEELRQIEKATGVTQEEVEEFTRFLSHQELERYNFKHR